MTTRYFWVGSQGPLMFNDADAINFGEVTSGMTDVPPGTNSAAMATDATIKVFKEPAEDHYR